MRSASECEPRRELRLTCLRFVLAFPIAFAGGSQFRSVEDFGDDLFARVLEQHPKKERELYEAATDVLIELHKANDRITFYTVL